MDWIRKSLTRRLVFSLIVVLTVVSLIFLVLVVSLYRDRLVRANAEIPKQVTSLLQASLENAMLKRDLDGLRQIVTRLGEQPGIEAALIVNRQREVRFASAPAQLGKVFDERRESNCYYCLGDPAAIERRTDMVTRPDGHAVLRSVVPVRNRDICAQCHGPPADHPVNGVLIVEHDADRIAADARSTAIMLGGAGSIALLTAALAIFLVMRRNVLAPIGALNAVAGQLSTGDLDSRVAITGDDELADLGRTVNTMADSLQSQMRALATRERFLQDLIDALPDGLRVIDENAQVILANKEYADQLNMAPSEAVGRPCFAAQGRTERCVPTLLVCPLETLNETETTAKYTHRHVRADGSQMPVEITAGLVRAGPNGDSQRLIIEVIRDLERDMHISHQQRLAELGQLAAGTAHEIYNPLSSAKLGLQSLARRDGGGRRSPTGEYIAIVEREIDKCIDVTKRLLALATPPSRRPQLVSLHDIIPDVISLLRFEAEAKGIDVTVDLGTSDLRVLATDPELRMVFLNLIQNAYHAMPDGGRLTITGDKPGGIRIRVRDTGVGIPQQLAARIFDPFYSRRADNVAGTGLGLTISLAIIRRYGGDLTVVQGSGTGACFEVTLPDADIAQSERQPADSALQVDV